MWKLAALLFRARTAGFARFTQFTGFKPRSTAPRFNGQSRKYSTYRSFNNAVPPSQFISVYRKPLLYLGGVMGIIYVTNLHQVPVSGRWRFIIVPRWLELKVGESSYEQIMAQFRGQLLPANHPDVVKVRSIMNKLIKVSGLEHSDVDWKINVISGDQPPNAFVLPGGKVFVFQSILPITKNDDGLATVLSHELAHQVCRHTAESMSWSPIYLVLAAVLYGITGASSLDDLLMSTVLKLPASRTMETEADYVGVMMMARACFDPSQAVGLWQRMRDMETKSGMNVPELLSTHPASERRIENIKKEIPDAMRVRAEYCGDLGTSFSNFWG